jgi:hypothetical protein
MNILLAKFRFFINSSGNSAGSYMDDYWHVVVRQKEIVLKTLKFTALIVTLAMLFGFTAALAGAIEVNGDIRYRTFMDNRDFDSDTEAYNWSEMRSRVNLSASSGDNLNFFMQMQDSRTIGAESSVIADNGMYSMHQAYFTYSPCEVSSFMAGKFALGLHNERLVGKVGWSNVGRTFEGFVYNRDFGMFDLTFLGTQLDEVVTTEGLNNDTKLMGFNFALPQFDFFTYWAYDELEASDFSLMTLGMYRKHAFGAMDYEFMGAYQMGSYVADVDVAAMMIFGEFGYTLANNARVAFLMDYTSGDDATDATEFGGFNNLFYTGHKFRGAMDYFVGDNDEGLMDMAFKFNYPVNDAWGLSAAAHMFTLVEVAEDAEDALGNELDFAATYTDGAFKWTNGLSMFMTGDAFVDEADNSMWFYSQFTAGF